MRVIEPLLDPPTDVGLLYPAPESVNGSNVIVALGDPASESSNRMSGIIRHINANLCPSSKSNCAEVI